MMLPRPSPPFHCIIAGPTKSLLLVIGEDHSGDLWNQDCIHNDHIHGVESRVAELRPRLNDLLTAPVDIS
jgi:hypothetical protein